MSHVLSVAGLAVAVWVACLGFLSLLAGMFIGFAWHPHFLPVTMALALVIATGLALIVVASWRVVRGLDRRRALACLLIGAAPLWFLAGFFLYGVAAGTGRMVRYTLALRLLAPLAESVMDLEARLRYPQRTYGEMVIMISPPMPEAQARAQVAAMDRHIRALDERLGRQTTKTVRWVRGPLLGMRAKAIVGLCIGSRPGEELADAEGLVSLDRHEVAHCVLTSHCSSWVDPPALLIEGWAHANQGDDAVMEADRLRENWARNTSPTLRQLTGPDWYDWHKRPAYTHGAALVNFLIDHFGPEKFLQLYTSCRRSTFESDCRRIFGLNLEGLDAAYRADVERRVGQASSHDGVWLERRPLGPGVNPSDWEAFLSEYLAAAAQMVSPYRQIRLNAASRGSTTDGEGRTHPYTSEVRVLRSGEFVSLRQEWSGNQLAYLAHPRRSILARRDAPNHAWEVEDQSKRAPEQAHYVPLGRIDDSIAEFAAPLVALSRTHLDLNLHRGFTVTRLEHFEENGRPRVRIRFENSSPTESGPLHAATYVLAADELFASQSARLETLGPDKTSYQSEFAYDRHEGIPVLRSVQSSQVAAGAEHDASELRVVERSFEPIPEEAFDPDRFLDGPQVKAKVFEADEPSVVTRLYVLPLAISALCLIGGAAMSWRSSFRRYDPTSASFTTFPT
jgi:hypothetical protein